MMVDICKKPLSCPSYCPSYDGLNDSEMEFDCHTRGAALQDKLADCLLCRKSENTNCIVLDALSNQFDQVEVLSKGETFDAENNLTKLYPKIYATSTNSVLYTTSQHCDYRRRASSLLLAFPCMHGVYWQQKKQKKFELLGHFSTYALVMRKYIQ